MIRKTATEEIKIKLLEKMEALCGKKVLVVGDVGVDEYILGQVRRISPEAPVPVLDVEEEDSRLGLSANVAQNVVSLGGIPYLVSVMGEDPGAEVLTRLLRKNHIATEHLIVDTERPTTRKTRVMAKHHHLVRVDHEMRQFVSAEIRRQIFERIEHLMPQIDTLILQDYGKGVIDQVLVQQTVQKAHAHGKKVLLDPHRSQPLDIYQGVDILKPNFEEALALLGMTYEDFKMHNKSILELGQRLRERAGAQWIVLTEGKEGMTIFDGKEANHVPTYARQVFDVTGAGDTVIAAIGLALSAGFSMEESCVLANFAAGVVVGKVGCVPCDREELVAYIQSH